MNGQPLDIAVAVAPHFRKCIRIFNERVINRSGSVFRKMQDFPQVRIKQLRMLAAQDAGRFLRTVAAVAHREHKGGVGRPHHARSEMLIAVFIGQKPGKSLQNR
jgi:hypothetical protein